uniref:Uncharacterized protein n=1 Tax=Oryza glaberrima TaxID=4538 RepID=I1QLD5_ORYGL
IMLVCMQEQEVCVREVAGTVSELVADDIFLFLGRVMKSWRRFGFVAWLGKRIERCLNLYLPWGFWDLVAFQTAIHQWLFGMSF